MKPRLEPAPHTAEDMALWVYFSLRNPLVLGRRVAGLFLFYQAADRRDADVMLYNGTARRDPLATRYILRLMWAFGWIGCFPRLPASDEL